MIKDTLKVVVDADAIIAMLSPEDLHHLQAMAISRRLLEEKATIIYPTTAIIEATTYTQRVQNNTSGAFEMARGIIQSGAQIIEVDRVVIERAMKYFSPVSSKKNTLFDCIVAAIAELNGAEVIFSFDKFYKTKGFKLALELL